MTGKGWPRLGSNKVPLTRSSEADPRLGQGGFRSTLLGQGQGQGSASSTQDQPRAGHSKACRRPR